MASPAMYDPYNYVSFVELNKRKRGDYDRPESQRLENRIQKPAVKRIYLKRNGDASYIRPKLYVWRQWQAPSLAELTEMAGDFVGIHDAYHLYDHDGHRVTHEADIHENATYYVAGDESFYPSNLPQIHPQHSQPLPMKSRTKTTTRTDQLRSTVSHSDLAQNPYDEGILYNPVSQSHPELFPARSYYSLSQNGSSRNLGKHFDVAPSRLRHHPNDDQKNGETEYMTYTSAHSRHGIRRPLKKLGKGKPKNKKTKANREIEVLEPPKSPSMVDYEDAYREALELPTVPPILLDAQPASTSRDDVDQPLGYDYYENDRSSGRRSVTKPRAREYDDYDAYSAKSRGRELVDYDDGDYSHRYKQHSAPDAYYREKHSAKPRSRRAQSTNSANRNPEDSMISDFHDEEAALRDKLALEKHKHKHLRHSRSHSAQIFNRKDQTNPSAYIIYVFLNGNGMDCQYVDFSRSQLEKGMPYVLELCARKYRVNPARLVNMDGKKINEVGDMMSRGAYVLIPVGQNFRDTWYFLPDNAIDTSVDAEKVRARSAQRDRYIQKKERDERKKTSHKRSKSSDYYRR